MSTVIRLNNIESLVSAQISRPRPVSVFTKSLDILLLSFVQIQILIVFAERNIINETMNNVTRLKIFEISLESRMLLDRTHMPVDAIQTVGLHVIQFPTVISTSFSLPPHPYIQYMDCTRISVIAQLRCCHY